MAASPIFQFLTRPPVVRTALQNVVSYMGVRLINSLRYKRCWTKNEVVLLVASHFVKTRTSDMSAADVCDELSVIDLLPEEFVLQTRFVCLFDSSSSQLLLFASVFVSFLFTSTSWLLQLVAD